MTNPPRARSWRGPGGPGVLVLLLSLPPVVGVTASTASAAPATLTAACAHRTVPPGILGVVPARAPSGCAVGHAAATRVLQPVYGGGNPPLVYHGGAVVGTPATTGENTVHAVFWAPPGYSFPGTYEAGIDRYLADVAAASGSASNVYAVGTQYTDGHVAGSPHVRYAVHVGTAVDAADPYPTSGGCSPDTGHGEGYARCLTDAQMHTELDHVLTAHGLPSGLGTVFLLIFPPNVETCTGTGNGRAGGACSDTAYPGFCGYHSAYWTHSAYALYADIPYPTAFGATCLGSDAPSGSLALDSTLTTISHEHNETITDPYGGGWIDSLGNENGDECAWNFGTALGGGPGARWNQVINNHHYELQQEFSNEDYALDAAAGCALTQSVPTASLVVTTTHPTTGAPVGFDGRASSVANVPHGITDWAWAFGDAGPVVHGATPTHAYPVSGTYAVSLTVTDTDGFTATTTRLVAVGTTPGPQSTASGYWLVGADGGIFSFGSAGFYGSTGKLRLQRPVVGISPTADRLGYWLVGSDGGVFAFGDSGYYGSLPGMGFSPAGSDGTVRLAAPIVAMVPSVNDAGYFMVAADGGVFAFGDARYAGSCPGIGGCSGTAVAVMPDATGNGYWLVTATGNVYTFGDAQALGSPPRRTAPVTSAVRTPDGGGYWVLFADGTLAASGDAGRYGDPTGALGTGTATAVFTTADGAGYWVASAAGGVYPYGDATADGSMAGARLNAPIVAASGW